MNGRRGRFQAVAAVAFVFIGLIGIFTCCWHYPFAGNPAAWSIGGIASWFLIAFKRLEFVLRFVAGISTSFEMECGMSLRYMSSSTPATLQLLATWPSLPLLVVRFRCCSSTLIHMFHMKAVVCVVYRFAGGRF